MKSGYFSLLGLATCLIISTNALAQERRSALMERMIESGHLERTQFTEAVSRGDADAVRTMFLEGYDVESVSARLGLVVASDMGYIEITRVMLLAGVRQRFYDREFSHFGRSGLSNPEEAIVPGYLSFGRDSWLALTVAIKRGHADIVRLLLLSAGRLSNLMLSDLIYTAQQFRQRGIESILSNYRR